MGFAETRGTLFFEIARLAKEIQPQYLFLENVKGLLNHDGGNTFRTILSTLDELGYDAEWQICNSKDYGVAQNRERVFIVGHLRGRSRREVFPIRSSYREIGNVQGQQVYANTLTTRTGQANGTGSYILEREQHEKIIKAVLTPDRADKRQNGRRIKEPGEPMFTLTAQDRHGVLIREATKKGYAEAQIGDSINFSNASSKTRRGRVGKGVAQTLDTACNQAIIENKPPYRIRKLTPRECWRLQGFPDWAFDKAQEVNSNNQLYKQAGNSVTVPVIYEIAKRLQ